MEPLPDISKRVGDHAQRAYILAQIETRPPGYSVDTWAGVLMDEPFDRLLGRYARRVAVERSRVEASALAAGARGVDLLFQQGFVLPAVPATPPPALAAKARRLYAQWAEELVQLECLEALQPLMGKVRSVEVMHQAQALILDCLARLTQEHQFPSYSAKLTMNKNGSFTVNLTSRD